MIIGTFQTATNGYAGQIRTLLIDAMIAIIPAVPSGADNAPDWRVLLVEADDGVEVGAGWDRTGERAGAYIALLIDDPALGAPLRANLVRSPRGGGDYHLLWSRPAQRERA